MACGHILDSCSSNYKSFRELAFTQCGRSTRTSPCIKKLYRVRTEYKKAIVAETDNHFTIDDVRLLSCLVSEDGPYDHALGTNALGATECLGDNWRWTFKDISTNVFGDWHDTEGAAVADLVRLQSMLFPPHLPPKDWFEPTRRAAHLQRVKKSAQKIQAHGTSVVGQQEPHLPTQLAYPHDKRTLQNDFPGFRNLGNTCYLNAVLQCIFNCEPLASHLFAPAQNAGIVESSLRDLLAEYVASGVSTADVISPITVLHQVSRHAGLSLGRQHDAAECLRQLLQYTGLGQRLCDSQADVMDGSVLICYTPEAAQVSVAAAAIDVRALLLEATTGDRALKKAPQALAIRIENTYEQGGQAFWVDARVAWPNEALTLTTTNAIEPQADYDVQAYLVHRHEQDAPVSAGMRSGHYVAYFKHGAAWYLADDANITLLTELPTEFPYLVFLARCDRASGEHMSAMRKRMQGIKKARREAPEIVGSSGAATPQAEMVAMASPNRPKRHRSGRVQVRDGIVQVRDSRVQVRDESDRVQVRDHRLDERVDHAWGNRGSSDNRDHARTDDTTLIDPPLGS